LSLQALLIVLWQIRYVVLGGCGSSKGS